MYVDRFKPTKDESVIFARSQFLEMQQTLFRKLQRFSDENGGNEIDWSCPYSKKFFIAYKDGKLFYDWMTET